MSHRFGNCAGEDFVMKWRSFDIVELVSAPPNRDAKVSSDPLSDDELRPATRAELRELQRFWRNWKRTQDIRELEMGAQTEFTEVEDFIINMALNAQ